MIRAIIVVVGALAASSSYGQTAQTGCVGLPVGTCIANLSANMTISQGDETQRELSALDEVDVNGKPIGNNRIGVYGYLPRFPQQSVMVMLELTREKIVKSADSNLVGDPKMARTSAEYDDTGLYDVASMLLGTSCPQMNKIDLYRFFENQIKPKVVAVKEKPEISEAGAKSDYFEKAPSVPFCGRKLTFVHLFGFDTDDITLENPHGAFSRPSIIFE